MNFAAAHVDMIPGDKEGLWNRGHICGQCFQVKVATKTGWKETVVRIMDKCPDAFCGVDLGGYPAKQLMENHPGRYSGVWKRVSCDGQINVSDGATTLVTKEGSNAWWSLVQVRNPPSEVIQIRWKRDSDLEYDTLPWASEAENFFKIPTELLTSNDSMTLYVEYWSEEIHTLHLRGIDLGKELQSWVLSFK